MNGEWTIPLWILVGVVFLVKIAPVRRIVSTVRQQPLLVQTVAVLTLCLARINGSTKTNSQNSASRRTIPAVTVKAEASVSPPSYLLFVRMYNTDKTTILHQESPAIYAL